MFINRLLALFVSTRNSRTKMESTHASLKKKYIYQSARLSIYSDPFRHFTYHECINDASIFHILITCASDNYSETYCPTRVCFRSTESSSLTSSRGRLSLHLFGQVIALRGYSILILIPSRFKIYYNLTACLLFTHLICNKKLSDR